MWTGAGLIADQYFQGARKKELQAARMNDLTLRQYNYMLVSLACSTIKFTGLPDEIDRRYVNMSLVNRGLSIFFYDDDFGKFFSLTGTAGGKINMYNNPTKYIAYGASGYKKFLAAKDCVPIWSNYLRKPELDVLSIYARRLADIDRTIDVNLANQKHPLIAVIPEEQRLTYENFAENYYGNTPFIVGANGAFDPTSIGYATPDVPYNTDKLLVDKGKIWNEIMTYLGIDNTNMEKRERTNVEEVQANNGQIEAMRLSRLDTMRWACEEINMKFGLDVWVEFNHDISTENYQYMNTIENFANGENGSDGEKMSDGSEGDE